MKKELGGICSTYGEGIDIYRVWWGILREKTIWKIHTEIGGLYSNKSSGSVKGSMDWTEVALETDWLRELVSAVMNW
jgi:hypothetical protein